MRLSDSSSYQVRVYARNRAGESPPSAAVTGATISPARPGQPAPPELTAMARNSLIAKWRAPADGGTPLTFYQLRWKAAQAPERSWRTERIAPQSTETMLDALTEGETYQVQVRAQNRLGPGPWSPTVQAAASFTQRSQQAASAALARVGNVLAAGAVDVLSSRLTGSSGASIGRAPAARNRLTLAGLTLTPLAPRAQTAAHGMPPRRHDAAAALGIHTHETAPAPSRSIRLDELLTGSDFELRLTRAEAGQPNGRARAARVAPSSDTGAALWGRGTLRGFQSKTDNELALSGNAYGGWFGVDYSWRRATLGLAGAFHQTRTDFRSSEAPDGDVATQMGGVYPYLAVAPHERFRLWVLAGFGWGSLEFAQDDAASVDTDLTMQVYAGGASFDLVRSRGFRLAAKSDASHASFRTQAQPGLPAISSSLGRFRLALDSRLNANWTNASLSPSLEAAMRLDYGDAASGGRSADLGMEIGGGLLYQHRKIGLTLNARGRWLVLHQDASAQEWGASFLLRIAPDALGRGMSASLRPNWGRTQSRRDELWREERDASAHTAQRMRWQPDRLQAELGYGFALANQRALLTPFATWSLTPSGAHSAGGGARVRLTNGLRLKLEGEQRRTPLAPADHRISLQLSMPLGG